MSDPVSQAKPTLADLRVRTETWDERDQSYWRGARPAAVSDLVDALRELGAETEATAFRQLGTEGKFGWRVEVDGPGSFLVLNLSRLEEQP